MVSGVRVLLAPDSDEDLQVFLEVLADNCLAFVSVVWGSWVTFIEDLCFWSNLVGVDQIKMGLGMGVLGARSG